MSMQKYPALVLARYLKIRILVLALGSGSYTIALGFSILWPLPLTTNTIIFVGADYEALYNIENR